MLTQESMMARFHALTNEGESALNAVIIVGIELSYEETRIVSEGRDEVAYINCMRLAKWWGEHSRSLRQLPV